ncbi:HAD family phosphatase [Candidatus Woesearchaeota archaeon]|nr:HAD family phosphatase [Candidatus Woesearchaeota archaeon]
MKKKYKLVCFDVDGTLVDNVEFSWQLFHNYFETDEKRRIKARDMYYAGEISYLEWANHDIGMWIEKKAARKQFFDALKKNNVQLMKGAMETISKLKEAGIKLAIISGSLDIIMEYLMPDYNAVFDDVFFSRLIFDEKGVLKSAKATEYDMIKKADALKKIAKREGFKLSECVFVGDHHNDVKIIQESGLGICFDCKSDDLRKVADIEIKNKDLREILKHIL